MPRPARLLLSHSYYHIMTRGNNLNVVFRVPADYSYYLSLLKKYKATHSFDLYHYCLMPNHTHFLIRTLDAHQFAVFMKKLNLAYFHHFNKNYGWVGHFWQDRYKSQPVGKDNYFIQCGKYIELNPVRAGIYQSSDTYAYSSYGYYANGVRDDLVTEDFFYTELGASQSERQIAYKSLLIEDVVNESFNKPTWGSAHQRYNESKKRANHLN